MMEYKDSSDRLLRTNLTKDSLMRKRPTYVNLRRYAILGVMVLWLSGIPVFQAEAEDVYSLFGKLFLSGRVEYDFTNRRDFLSETDVEQIRQNDFDFDRVFRRGFHSVMVIEETAGNVKNILSLGEVPTTFTKSTFDRIDFSGVRWDVRAERTDWTFIMVPSLVNPVVGREDLEGSGFGIREITKFGKSKLGLSWYFRDTPVWAIDMETNFANYGLRGELAVTPKGALDETFTSRFDATTTVFKGFRTVGDTIFQAEAFRVGHLFDASRSVGDNDDGDRYTDNTGEDPPSLIIPGDLDKNNNGTFDYEDDILLFDVDEDFLDEAIGITMVSEMKRKTTKTPIMSLMLDCVVCGCSCSEKPVEKTAPPILNWVCSLSGVARNGTRRLPLHQPKHSGTWFTGKNLHRTPRSYLRMNLSSSKTVSRMRRGISQAS